jgi:hypothetical protein
LPANSEQTHVRLMGVPSSVLRGALEGFCRKQNKTEVSSESKLL